MNHKSPFRWLAGTLPGVLLGLALSLPSATVAQITNGVYAPDATIYGKTYPQWFATNFQWCYSLETIHHPLYDTADLSTGQSGPVWFLGCHWEVLNGGSQGVNFSSRTGVVPAGTALFVNIIAADANNCGCPPTPPDSWAQLLAITETTADELHDLTCTVDGVAVQNLLADYLFHTPPYTYMTPPNNNILEINDGCPCYNDHSATPSPWTITSEVDDGFCVMVAPLAIGPHTIQFSWQYGNPTSISDDVTYNICVVATNLGNSEVFAPDSAPYGQTYAQWSAAYWKWLYSLPVNGNPLFGTADLSAGQSGKVWFLGGAYTNGVLGGTAVRSGTIPDGTALFVPLINWESATAEGNGSTYGQLFANSQFLLDHATNLSFTIDGQPVQNLEHYRAQSALYTWGPLPSNNIFGDPTNFPAGLTSQSVADGYEVLLTPLPVGAHTLHATGGIVTSVANGDPSDFNSELDLTYNLTVTPASLSVVQQGTNAVLSWPQTGTSYVLEISDSLNPANWSPSAASIVPVGATYQATVPKSGGSQFFRLLAQ